MSRYSKGYDDGFHAGQAAGKEYLAKLIVDVYGLDYKVNDYINYGFAVVSIPLAPKVEHDLETIVHQGKIKAEKLAADALIRGTDARTKLARKNLGLDK